MPIKSFWLRSAVAATLSSFGLVLASGFVLNSAVAAPPDVPSPFDSNPSPPATSPATPDPTAPATPAIPGPGEAPATAPSTPAVPPMGTLPDNPFGDTTPAPGADNTAPQVPRDTTPGPSTTEPGPSGPSAPEYTPAQQAINLGKQQMADGKYVEAWQQFEEATKADPREAQAFFYLGRANRMLGHLDDAIDAYTKAIDLTTQDSKLDPEANFQRGIVWFLKGEYGIAWQDFDEASALMYDDPAPEFWKGLSRAKQQNWLDAVNSYAVALEHDDKYAPAWVNLGLGYLALEQPNKAVYCLNQALRIDPRNAATYFKRGVALSRWGKFKEAADSFSQAIRLKPDYAEAYFNRSLVNRDLGNSDQAAKDRAEALKLNPQIEKQPTSTS